jgi:hypothetical protein
MSELSQVIEPFLSDVWREPLITQILSKKIDTSIYSTLREGIPDEFVFIEEVFPKNELGEIWDNYKQYLSEDKIYPFLGTMGDAVICIGYGEENLGKIFYFDFDFGALILDDDDLPSFLEKLVEK